MGIEFARATTTAEIEAVQRLRYVVYVEEMGRYDGVDGAEEGRFAEPEMSTAGSTTPATAIRSLPRPG